MVLSAFCATNGDAITPFPGITLRSVSDHAAQMEVVLQLAEQPSPYPRAPALIQQGWQALVPAILELSEHHNNASHTIWQTLRRAARPPGRRRGGVSPMANAAQSILFNHWFYDLLVLLGTLPIETNELGDRAQKMGLSRYLAEGAKDGDAESAISAQSRNDAMECLDLMCTRVWYARHIDRKTPAQLHVLLFQALQYIYWECGVPTTLTLMSDEPPRLDDRIYEEVRILNFRQLYALHDAGAFPTLINNVYQGIDALQARRAEYATQFAQMVKRDARWETTFAQHAERIGEKYKAIDKG